MAGKVVPFKVRLNGNHVGKATWYRFMAIGTEFTVRGTRSGTKGGNHWEVIDPDGFATGKLISKLDADKL